MINSETGMKLTGDQAPLAIELEAWLAANPGFQILPPEEGSEEEDEVSMC